MYLECLHFNFIKMLVCFLKISVWSSPYGHLVTNYHLLKHMQMMDKSVMIWKCQLKGFFRSWCGETTRGNEIQYDHCVCLNCRGWKLVFTLRNILTKEREKKHEFFPFRQQTGLSSGRLLVINSGLFFFFSKTNPHMGGDAAGTAGKTHKFLQHSSKWARMENLGRNHRKLYGISDTHYKA